MKTFTCVQCGNHLPISHRSQRRYQGSWTCKGCAELAREHAKAEAERDAQRAAVASQATRSARHRVEDRMAEREYLQHLAEVWDELQRDGA